MSRGSLLLSTLLLFGLLPRPDTERTPISLSLPSAQATVSTPHAAPVEGSIGQVGKLRGMRVGVSLEASDLRSDRVMRTVAQNFTTVTPENALKIGRYGRPTSFDWTDADQIAAFARDQGLGMRLHTLIWEHRDGQAPGMSTMSHASCSAWLHNHTQAVIGRYADLLAAVDVVNEPLDARGNVYMPRWSACLNDDPVGVALDEAHAALVRAGHPNVELVINEYDVLMPGPKADGYWLLARNLKDRGSPVTTIGFQAHLGLEDRLDEGAMRDNLRRFADMGYNIEITEMDVVARNPRTSRVHADEREAQLMSQVVAACVAAAGPRCVGVTAWGLTDALHHKVRGVAGSHETPTLFDEDVSPKPAYAAVAQAISKARPTL